MVIRKQRNWKKVTLKSTDDGSFQLMLDHTLLQTPLKNDFRISNRHIANKVVAEWSKLSGEIKLNEMPYTLSCFLSIDRNPRETNSLKHELVLYGMSDLLLYRAEQSSELEILQSQFWDPLVGWMYSRYKILLQTTNCIAPKTQEKNLYPKIASIVHLRNSIALTALKDIVKISGSLIIGLAIIESEITPKKAWKIVTIDETWQKSSWGTLEEHIAVDREKQRIFFHACRIIRLLNKE